MCFGSSQQRSDLRARRLASNQVSFWIAAALNHSERHHITRREYSVQSSNSARPIERGGLCTLRSLFFFHVSGACSFKKTLQPYVALRCTAMATRRRKYEKGFSPSGAFS